jgi:uncharacterized membrane protein|tara:strand:- start:8 stop:298 length:291 start_codon:yes stop_codon:yes gene_type:complete
MILLAFIAGVVGGLQTSFLNGMCLSLQKHGSNSAYQTLVFFMVAGIFAALQLKLLNKAMEVYDQVEIIPIYQTSLILFNIVSGSIVLNQVEMYDSD